MIQTYKIYCPSYSMTKDEADEIKAASVNWAVQLWCKEAEDNGNFVDGYPQNLHVVVIDENDVSHDMIVDTEFEPDFCIYKRSI